METKTAGRKKLHKDSAARVKAFRDRAKYPGYRCDVYMGEDAYAVLLRLKRQTGLSNSGVIDSILEGKLKISGND
jgi:hypothetical protein